MSCMVIEIEHFRDGSSVPRVGSSLIVSDPGGHSCPQGWNTVVAKAAHQRQVLTWPKRSKFTGWNPCPWTEPRSKRGFDERQIMRATRAVIERPQAGKEINSHRGDWKMWIPEIRYGEEQGKTENNEQWKLRKTMNNGIWGNDSWK